MIGRALQAASTVLLVGVAMLLIVYFGAVTARHIL